MCTDAVFRVLTHSVQGVCDETIVLGRAQLPQPCTLVIEGCTRVNITVEPCMLLKVWGVGFMAIVPYTCSCCR